MPRIVTPEWRDQNDNTRYPFAETATMVARDGRVLLEGMILDAAIYPVGGRVGMFLTAIDVGPASVTIFVGNEGNEQLCFGSYLIEEPKTRLALLDINDRAAGVLIFAEGAAGALRALGRGLHEFAPETTEFCASTCVPTPELGVRGILLEDGTLMTGDIWLLGDDGVVLTAVDGINSKTIRVDIVGDPLFRRRLCGDNASFDVTRPIRQVRFTGPDGEDFTVTPDEMGNISLTTSGVDVSDTVLRIATSEEGIMFLAVGRQVGI